MDRLKEIKQKYGYSYSDKWKWAVAVDKEDLHWLFNWLDAALIDVVELRAAIERTKNDPTLGEYLEIKERLEAALGENNRLKERILELEHYDMRKRGNSR